MSTEQNGSKAGTPSPERLGSRTCKHCYRVSGNAGQSVKCVHRNEWVDASNKACDKFVGANTKGEAPQ